MHKIIYDEGDDGEEKEEALTSPNTLTPISEQSSTAEEPIAEEPISKASKIKSNVDFEIEAMAIIAEEDSFESAYQKILDIYPGEGAEEELSKVGALLRQRFRIKEFDPNFTYNNDIIVHLSELESDTIEEDDIDRIRRWRDANLEYIENTTDPRVILNKDIWKNSVETAANFTEGSIRGRSRGIFGKVLDAPLRFAEGAVDPLYRLVTGEDFKSLDKYIDPSRNEDISSEVSSILGTLAGYTIPAVPLIISGAGSSVAFTLGSIPAMLGFVRERYETGLDVTGEEDRATKAAGIEAAAQIIGTIPFVRYGGRAVDRLLKKQIFEGSKFLISKAALEGATVEAIQSGISNESLAYALDNKDIGFFDGVAKSAVYGGILGGALQGIASYGSPIKPKEDISEIDTALTGVEAVEKGVKNDEARLRGLEAASVLREEDLMGQPTPEEVVFNKQDSTYILKDGEVIESESVVPIPEEVTGLKPVELPELDSIADPNDTVVESVVDNTVLTEDGKVNTSDKIFISRFPNGVFSDLEYAPGALRVATSLAAELVQKNPQEFLKFVKNTVGKYGYFSWPKKDTKTVQPNDTTIRDARVVLSKKLFSNPIAAIKTMAHELGHFIDILNDYMLNQGVEVNPNTKTLVMKLKFMKDDLSFRLPENTELWRQAEDISARWRPGYKKDGYRNTAKEIYADVFSALMLAPDLVKEYPQVYKTLDEGFSKSPELKNLWNWWKNISNNLRVLEDLNIDDTVSSIEKTFKRHEASQKLKQNNKSLWTIGKNLIQEIRLALFNVNGILQSKIDRVSNPDTRNILQGMLRIIKDRNTFISDYTKNFLVSPTQKIINYFIKNLPMVKDKDGNLYQISKQEAMVDWNNFLNARRLLRNTSLGIEIIKKVKFEDAYSIVKNVFENPVFEKIIPDKLRNALKEVRSINDLIDLMATFDMEVSTKPPDKLPDYIIRRIDRLDVNDPEYELKKQNIIESYYRRFEKIDVAPNRKAFNDIFKELYTGDIATVLFDPKTYHVRKYMLNQRGTTWFDANQTIKNLKDKWGENYFLLEKASKDFYKVLSNALPIYDKAGIFNNRLLSTIALNADNWVHYQLVDYFTDFYDIDGAIKAATGAYGDRTPVIPTSIFKVQALVARSYVQIAKNTLASLASNLGYNVEYKRLSKSFKANDVKVDPNDLVVPVYANGVPYAAIIKGGKQLSPIINTPDQGHLGPVLGTIGNTLGYIRDLLMVRQFRTVFNPVFSFINEPIREFQNLASLTMPIYKTINPFIIAKKLAQTLPEATKEVREYFKNPDAPKSELLEDAIRFNLFPSIQMEYGAGLRTKSVLDNFLTNMAMAYEVELEVPNTFLESVHKKGAELLDKTWLSRKTKGLFKATESMAEHVDAISKFATYKMAIDSGMPKEVAANFARNHGGVPDPTGGGYLAKDINNFTLFGRVYLNSIRNSAILIKDYGPYGVAAAGINIILPRILYTSGFLSIIAAIYGKEAEDIYKKFLRKVPSFDKISRLMIPIGFIDDKGDLRVWGTFESKEIGANWKSANIGIPQAHTYTDLTRVLWPLINATSKFLAGQDDPFKDVYSKTGEGIMSLGSGLLGRMTPPLQWAYNIAQYATGGNPHDFFRNKPVFPKDVAQAGGFWDRTSIMAQYMANQLAPNIIGFDPYRTITARTWYDELSKIPLAGPLSRSFFRVSNYGDVEASEEEFKDRLADLSGIRLEAGDAANEMYFRYTQVKSVKKERRNKNEVKEAKVVMNWYKRYKEIESNILNAKEKDDLEEYQYWIDKLDEESEKFLKYLTKPSY
jgi:hypothetical protein